MDKIVVGLAAKDAKACQSCSVPCYTLFFFLLNSVTSVTSVVRIPLISWTAHRYRMGDSKRGAYSRGRYTVKVVP